MAGTVGMHPFWCKTKIQNLGASPPDGSVTVGGVVVESVDEFVYLAVSLQSGCAVAKINSSPIFKGSRSTCDLIFFLYC